MGMLQTVDRGRRDAEMTGTATMDQVNADERSRTCRVHRSDVVVCRTTAQRERRMRDGRRARDEDREVPIAESNACHLGEADAMWQASGHLHVLRGASVAARVLWKKVEELATTPYPILLTGETGTGKTVLAREIHLLSRRRRQPFVSLGLPGIPEELRHSYLCGNTRGAFTGAISDRVGAMEQASSGTLFLDEVGFASEKLQQTLLTLLESRSVQRVGEVRERRVDVRFVFATTGDLRRRASAGTFLPELLYRVAQFEIHLPPLRERRGDIVPLASRFLADALREIESPFVAEIDTELAAALTSASWPGNLRELRAVCRLLAVSVRGDGAIGIEALAGHGNGVAAPQQLAPGARVLATLAHCGGNKARAARELGMSRGALYRTLERLGETPMSGRQGSAERL